MSERVNGLLREAGIAQACGVEMNSYLSGRKMETTVMVWFARCCKIKTERENKSVRRSATTLQI